MTARRIESLIQRSASQPPPPATMATHTSNMTTSMNSISSADSKRQPRRWTREEHDKFLRGLEMFPNGPWSRIAALVGSRTTRQTMTHAQKYRERMTRRANDVHALWDARGQSCAPISLAHIQETVRELPPLASSASGSQWTSSDEEFLEEFGVGGTTTQLDELDMHILMSLLSPETSDLTGTTWEPSSAPIDMDSQQLDHHIWSLLCDITDDHTQEGSEW